MFHPGTRYHTQERNSFVFLEWFENQLIPALKNTSLVVLDNASYHNVKTEDARNTPKMFAPPSARRNFFKCAPYLEILDPPLLMYYSDGRSNFPSVYYQLYVYLSEKDQIF
jgi:hypothetical protein